MGSVSFYHYDPYAQALAKVERGHDRDRDDVAQLLERGVVDRQQLLKLFEDIEPLLYRYPAIAPERFRERLEAALRPTGSS